MSAFTEHWPLGVAILAQIVERSLRWTETTYTVHLTSLVAKMSNPTFSHRASLAWQLCLQILCDEAPEAGTTLETTIAPIAAGIRCCCTGLSWSTALVLLQKIRPLDTSAELLLPEFDATISTCIKGRAFEIARYYLDQAKNYFLRNLDKKYLAKKQVYINANIEEVLNDSYLIYIYVYIMVFLQTI